MSRYYTSIRKIVPGLGKPYGEVEKRKRYESDRGMRRYYNMTIEQKEEMWQKQWRLCHICCRDIPALKDACVDHEHTTDQVRGILCQNCNKALGFLNDNKQTMLNMIDYIELSNEVA